MVDEVRREGSARWPSLEMVDEWSTRQDVEELHEPDRDWNRCAPEIQEVLMVGWRPGRERVAGLSGRWRLAGCA
jgi:hypothetical protein